jgi:enoyl-CoA hydratase/carnithine racemase
MNENILLAQEKDGVMVLSLNRPQVMNSLNFPLLHALRGQVESVRFKTHTRVIIITGAGEKQKNSYSPVAG